MALMKVGMKVVMMVSMKAEMKDGKMVEHLVE